MLRMRSTFSREIFRISLVVELGLYCHPGEKILRTALNGSRMKGLYAERSPKYPKNNQ
jgi:hypothetical protein